MNAKKLFTSCLLACSALAGAHAVADPIFSTQSASTINSIEFSFMNYSSMPSPNFSTMPLTSFDNSPAPAVAIAPSTQPASVAPIAAPAAPLPAALPAPQEIQPVIEVFVPSTPAQPSTPQLIETAAPPQQAAVVAAVIPEPGSVALLGLGLALLILRRREEIHG